MPGQRERVPFSHPSAPSVCWEQHGIRRRRSSQAGCGLRSCALDPCGDAERRAHTSYSEVGSNAQCSFIRQDICFSLCVWGKVSRGPGWWLCSQGWLWPCGPPASVFLVLGLRLLPPHPATFTVSLRRFSNKGKWVEGVIILVLNVLSKAEMEGHLCCCLEQ